jgi:hypothetical protein
MAKYHVFKEEQQDGQDPVWKEIGEIDAPSSGLAKRRLLQNLGIPSATVVAIPHRSWQPELLSAKQRLVYAKETASA